MARGKYQFLYPTDMYVSYTAHYKPWLSCGSTACLYQIPALNREKWSIAGLDHFIPQGESIKVNRVGPRPSQDSNYIGNKTSIQVLQPTAYLLHSTYKYTHAQWKQKDIQVRNHTPMESCHKRPLCYTLYSSVYECYTINCDHFITLLRTIILYWWHW